MIAWSRRAVRYPGLPIILYGHSLGGIQVLYYGLTRKPNVKGVIATSSGLAYCFGTTKSKSNDGKDTWRTDAKYFHCQRLGPEEHFTR